MTAYRRTPAVLVTAATPPTGDRFRAAAPALGDRIARTEYTRCRPRARIAPTRPTPPSRGNRDTAA